MTDAPPEAAPEMTTEPLLRGPGLWFLRLAVALIWLAGLASFFVTFPFSGHARWAMIIVGVIHVFEAFVFLPKLAAVGEAPARHALPILLLGSLHYFALPGTRPGA